MKFSYPPSGYPKYHEILGEIPIENFVFDYRKWVKPIFKYVNLIKIPFPAVEINRVDGIRFRPLYI